MLKKTGNKKKPQQFFSSTKEFFAVILFFIKFNTYRFLINNTLLRIKEAKYLQFSIGYFNL